MITLLFRSRDLCILLCLTMMGHLVAGYNTTGADSGCSSCSTLSDHSQSFTIRNALPQANSNLHMTCSSWNDCGEFHTYDSDFACNNIEFYIDDECTCKQHVCEFEWMKPNEEWFVRAQLLVWSSEAAAPKKTFYVVDDTGFWFSSSPAGTLKKIGSWVGGNYLSSETSIMGRVGKVKGFGRNHCRTRSDT